MGSRIFVVRDSYSREEFFTEFLLSPEVTIDTLQRILRRAGGQVSGKKDELVERILQAHKTNSVSTVDILIEFSRQSRQWLSFQLGEYQETPEIGTPEELPFAVGEDGWHGPIRADGDDVADCWYILTQTLKTYREIERSEPEQDEDEDGDSDEEQPSFEVISLRWHAVAEIRGDCAAVSWAGFTLSTEKNPKSFHAHPCWRDVQNMFERLKEHLAAEWNFPNLEDLTMHHVLEEYSRSDHPYANYEHLRIRAESSGVALSAQSASRGTKHSSGTSEFDVRGLKAFSEKLARVALRAVKPDYHLDELDGVERKILIAILREWGTKSYEFKLEFRSNPKDKKICKPHVYFGNRRDGTQDSFPHIKCNQSYGGSVKTFDFFLKELAERENSGEQGEDDFFQSSELFE